MSQRLRVAVLYGGRSSEHDVSRESAKCVIENLDPARFEVLPIAVDKQGQWHAQDLKRLQASTARALPIEAGRGVSLAAQPEGAVLQGAPGERPSAIDVVLPVLHGPNGEDGSVQGLLELSGVPYVGSGVLGSALCMDKDVAKRLVRAAGIETAPYVSVRAGRWPAQAAELAREIAALGPALFVKPANLGSSVGVTKVRDAGDPRALDAAVQHALRYDTKVLIERAVDGREIELAVLSSLDPGAPPEVSVPGEIVPNGEFYDYERKYLDPQGAELHIPAKLDKEQAAQAQDIARRAFVALECEGMARIDLFLDRQSGRLLFGEANTIPGFTTISMYPKLWEASGMTYRDLLSRLIALALQRHERLRQLDRGL
jgi:D-alanine-D-alanine ligase